MSNSHPQSKKAQMAARRNWQKLQLLGAIASLRSIEAASTTDSEEKLTINKSLPGLLLLAKCWYAQTQHLIRVTKNGNAKSEI